jgi:hypothetical protein
MYTRQRWSSFAVKDVLELREFAPEGEGISPNDGRNVLLLAGEIEDYDAPPTP